MNCGRTHYIIRVRRGWRTYGAGIAAEANQGKRVLLGGSETETRGCENLRELPVRSRVVTFDQLTN